MSTFIVKALFQDNKTDSFIDFEVKTMKFSGGEVNTSIHLTDDNRSWFATFGGRPFKGLITANIKSNDDLFSLLQITDALRKFGADKIDLTMPYIPYARQDRYMLNDYSDGSTDSLAIRIFADIINAQNYNEVIIWDAHSDVTPALIRNSRNIGLELLIPMLAFDSDTVIVSPDAGANKKIFKFAQYLGFDNVIRADKIRDVKTGAIVDTQVYTDQKFSNTRHLIVDDICDGGRTFIELAKALQRVYNNPDLKIDLLVTHGIFSKGIEVFDGLIDKIYTANNISGIRSPKLKEFYTEYIDWTSIRIPI